MNYYQEYVSHFARNYFAKIQAETKAEKVMYIIIAQVWEESPFKEEITEFYRGESSSPGTFKKVKVFEKEVARRRGLI